MHAVASASGGCPCHSRHSRPGSQTRATAIPRDTDYAFEMAASSIRYGVGVTSEIGADLKNWKAAKVAVFTDPNVAQLAPFHTVIHSLKRANVPHIVYDRVSVEPTDSSIRDAIDFVRLHQPDSFVAVGGGSTIDTAKAANLYLTHPKNEFLDFVTLQSVKGFQCVKIPTTAGTGSETTGVAIFDYVPKNFKTGIANRALKPTLGIIDPLNTRTMPPQVHVSSGLDVLCHALESYTAIPYNERSPRPKDPIERPAYQGSNPISDIWSLKALRMCVENLPKAYKNPTDFVAQEQMILAATFAGIGFGNAGVHLCHGMSYPISGLNKNYLHPGYANVAGVGKKLVPHGISVAVTAPAVFEWTAPACPDRHLEVAAIFGADISKATRADAGKILSDQIRKFLHTLDVPNGISAFGFEKSHVDALVVGTLPQHRVTKLAPHEATQQVLQSLFEKSFTIY
ncbi:mitochondrial hydroxyacid-oxoacid transhydrogenase [Rhizoclosmatium globosum]|uniref:Mitochondrial hydroxyacid-oxoacid transhydrogenase n=1 Tax=Rhizoclosmatium globosum TaxID=329046 RepID=A0A1Y2CS65_9FUNG|nr:mitochondrial hydroxyacid-oxoacid transhydrogenase [Rhizoclosmatium globosum]|eukprot:ORY49852.1 mitochondrial hydroxyacid-oxoacid transhydrogenase [Rhizoclosmatium globosum]